MITNPRLFGIPIAQRWDQLAVLFEDIEIYNVKVAVEIGIYLGGLADLFLLRQQFVPDFHYYGIEFDPNIINRRIFGKPEILIKDAHQLTTISEIQTIINQYGTAFIYCDGFDKPLEMRLYAPILRVGDLLMSHDVTTEVTEQSLIDFGRDFPYMEELDYDGHIASCLSLWRRKDG